MSQVIVPKDSATLGLPREKVSALNGNHMEIAKYSSKQDDNFIRVSGNIARLVDKVAVSQHRNSDAPPSESLDNDFGASHDVETALPNVSGPTIPEKPEEKPEEKSKEEK